MHGPANEKIHHRCKGPGASVNERGSQGFEAAKIPLSCIPLSLTQPYFFLSLLRHHHLSLPPPSSPHSLLRATCFACFRWLGTSAPSSWRHGRPRSCEKRTPTPRSCRPTRRRSARSCRSSRAPRRRRTGRRRPFWRRCRGFRSCRSGGARRRRGWSSRDLTISPSTTSTTTTAASWRSTRRSRPWTPATPWPPPPPPRPRPCRRRRRAGW
jgi:hypothetical protein